MGTQARSALSTVTWLASLVVIMSVALVALMVTVGPIGVDVPDDIGSWRWLTARLA